MVQYINANVDIFRKDDLIGATYTPIRCVMSQDYIVHTHTQSGIIKGMPVRGQKYLVLYLKPEQFYQGHNYYELLQV